MSTMSKFSIKFAIFSAIIHYWSVVRVCIYFVQSIAVIRPAHAAVHACIHIMLNLMHGNRTTIDRFI